MAFLDSFFLNEAGEDAFGGSENDIMPDTANQGGGSEEPANDQTTDQQDQSTDDQNTDDQGGDESGDDMGGDDSFGAAGDDAASDADAMGTEGGGDSGSPITGMDPTENQVKLNPFIKLKYIDKLTRMKIVLVDTIKILSELQDDQISDEIKLFIINSATAINNKISLILSTKVNELEADNLEKIYIAFEGKVSIINDLIKSSKNSKKSDDK